MDDENADPTAEEMTGYKKKLIFDLALLQDDLQGIIHTLAGIITLAAAYNDNDEVLRLAPVLGQLAEALEALR